MKEKLIPLRVPLIDSLSLSFELSKVHVVDERLTSQTVIYYESINEMDSELHPPKPLKLSFYGINLRFWLTNIPIYNKETQKKVPTTFINITMSSKLLKNRYFEGLTINNLLYWYNSLMSLKVVRMDYAVFKKGYVKDIDICINDRMSLKHFAQLVQDLYASTKSSVKHLVKPIVERDNVGINFNYRTNATSLKPYFKLYFKEHELLSKSSDFYNAWLHDALKNSNSSISELIRAEFTIKNYTHKSYLTEKGYFVEIPKTIEDILTTPLEQLYKIIAEQGLPSYLKSFNPKLKTDLSPTDTILLNFMKQLVILGQTKKQILDVVLEIEGKDENNTNVQRSRTRRKLEEIFKHIEDSKELKEYLTTNVKIYDYLTETLRFKI